MRFKNLKISTPFLSLLGSHFFVGIDLWNFFWFSVYLCILISLLRYGLYFISSMVSLLERILPGKFKGFHLLAIVWGSSLVVSVSFLYNIAVGIDLLEVK